MWTLLGLQNDEKKSYVHKKYGEMTALNPSTRPAIQIAGNKTINHSNQIKFPR